MFVFGDIAVTVDAVLVDIYLPISFFPSYNILCSHLPLFRISSYVLLCMCLFSCHVSFLQVIIVLATAAFGGSYSDPTVLVVGFNPFPFLDV
jgi:hypothetical protein